MNPPIILLGRHGAGKDTIARHISASFPSTANIKFSEFSKRLIASALDISYESTNDRQFRENHSASSTFGFTSDLTVLDLLNVLYEGSMSDTTAATHFVEAGVNYALNKAQFYKNVIFTDVRRFQEFEAILRQYGTNVRVIYLNDKTQAGEPFDEGDENISLLAVRALRLLGENFTQIDRYKHTTVLETLTQTIEAIQWN